MSKAGGRAEYHTDNEIEPAGEDMSNRPDYFGPEVVPQKKLLRDG